MPFHDPPRHETPPSNSPVQGIVYLAGAGPGDPGLVTLRTVDCLRRADVIIYDNLANPTLLDHARPGAELIYAGKKADLHIKTQDEINHLLADRARAGKVVVRLKGGDPFLFGRGGEEAAWLTSHGIAWEVVPGVTSAIAVPAYAGIPVTHRMVNGSLHIVTGHEGASDSGVEIDWSVLARSQGTIVILMGVKNLAFIAEQLMEHGLPGSTPVAMIRRGTLPEQQTLITQLDRAAKDVAAAAIKPPAVCVIGEVVRLREQLAWVEQRPLFGVRVAMTRPRDENDTLARALTSLGAEVLTTPTLCLHPLPCDANAQSVFSRLEAGEFDWVALTSGNGVREFMRMIMDSGRDARALSRAKIAVIGARTADALRAHNLSPDLICENPTQEGLAADLLAQAPRRVLVPRAAVARPQLEHQLSSAGIAVEILPLYAMQPDAAGIEKLRHMLERQLVHVVTFTSARTFEALQEMAGAPLPGLLEKCAIAVLGPVTRAAVEKAGLTVAIEAEKSDMISLSKAIADWHSRLA